MLFLQATQITSAIDLDASAGGDLIWGTPFDDTFQGGADDDEMRGLNGTDRLLGGEGNDTLWIRGDSADTALGSGGDDVIILDFGGGGTGTDILRMEYERRY